MRINRKLLTSNWDELEVMNLDDSYNILIDRIIDAMDTFAPETIKNLNKKNIPQNCWMTNELMTSLEKKNKLFKKVKGRDRKVDIIFE